MTPLTIRMHARDNVAIVANDGGLPAGTVLPDGLTLRDASAARDTKWPWSMCLPRHRCGATAWSIGYALKDIAAGSWVHERLLQMPSARALDDLPIATVKPDLLPAARGLHL